MSVRIAADNRAAWRLIAAGCRADAGEIPAPSSSTSISAIAPSRWIVTKTLPPPYFAAFFEQIADQFVQILALDPRDQLLVARRIEPHFGIQQRHRARDTVDAFADIGARLRRAAASDRAGAGEMMLDLPLHRRRLAPYRFRKRR